MRALLVVAVLAGSARADDPPKVTIRKPDPEVAKRRATDPNGFTGEIIVPPKDFADAQPWPRGMVITPPDPNDRMPNLLLRPWAWPTRHVWDRLQDAALGVIDALTSPHL